MLHFAAKKRKMKSAQEKMKRDGARKREIEKLLTAIHKWWFILQLI